MQRALARSVTVQATGQHLLSLLLSAGLEVFPGASVPSKLHDSCTLRLGKHKPDAGSQQKMLSSGLVRRKETVECTTVSTHPCLLRRNTP